MDGYVDLDLLSICLKDMQKSWEESGEGQAFPRSTMVGERGENMQEEAWLFGEERGLL